MKARDGEGRERQTEMGGDLFSVIVVKPHDL